MILSGATGEMDRILDRNMPPFFHILQIYSLILSHLISPHALILPYLTEIFLHFVKYHKKGAHLSHLKELFPLYIPSYINIPPLVISYRITPPFCHISQKYALIMSYNSFAPAPAPTRCYVPILCLNFTLPPPVLLLPFSCFRTLCRFRHGSYN